MSFSSLTPQEHKASSPQTLRCAVITVSDTRTIETDTGGAQVVERLLSAGHLVVRREIIRDEPTSMRQLLDAMCQQTDLDVILMTGGTGIASRDQTFETVSNMLSKPLPGYGELFRMLSYQEIGSAAMLSRATGGLLGSKVLLTMPGSPAAVVLAMEKLILPELGHLVREARR
jgi:molybdenum cofactor biosynthesis protein B